jgi:hypothetical protein
MSNQAFSSTAGCSAAVHNITPHLLSNNSASNALINIINFINAHNNDIFLTMLSVISSTYKISIDDMLEVIRTNPDFQAIVSSKDIAATIAPDIPKKRGRKPKVVPVVDPVVAPVVVPVAPKKKITIKRKIKSSESSEKDNEEVQDAPSVQEIPQLQEAQETPKVQEVSETKKKFRIKKKLENIEKDNKDIKEHLY